jgi:hypothetical protein
MSVESFLSTLPPALTSPDFNPVPHAIQLLNTNPVHTAKFNAEFAKLETVMDGIVDGHYKSFNESIHTFSHVVEKLQGREGR